MCVYGVKVNENVFDEHVCPLKCNGAFQNLLHKAHSKAVARSFKQTFN